MSEKVSTIQVVKPQTIGQRRWKKFKTIKRGYYSLLFLSVLYAISFLLPILVNNKALIVRYNNEYYFPAFKSLIASVPLLDNVVSTFQSGESLGQKGNSGDCHYRELRVQYQNEQGDNFIIMPIYPFNPIEDITTEGNLAFAEPLTSPDNIHTRVLGTDENGRDVFARMSYGFQVSITFALLLVFVEYLIGIPIGGLLGYKGGWVDLILQRFIEMWSTLPVLFLIIIVVSFVQPNFLLLVLLLSLTAWIPITIYLRAEFLREKSKDYVAAAISIGVPTWKIMFKHILPNSLVPIVTNFPFAIVAGLTALVSLDFLGFGLPPPTPSWGQMLSTGLQNITKWWLVFSPMFALFTTLIMIVFIGEAIREAFDPKTFSRLR
jgi:microcin C transport system permease protein